jgi:hypothetical protein
VNILDENTIEDQRLLLDSWGLKFRQIGENAGRSGMSDEQILALLLKSKGVTFFTRDNDFFDPGLRHSRYCLVHLATSKDDAAIFIRRFLKHPACNTAAKRLGCVFQVTSTGILCWRSQHGRAILLPW